MTDYIKREDAIKIINSGISVDTDADKRYVNGLFRAIRPADVAPVRHGRWIDKGDGAECSICGSFWEYAGAWDINGIARVFRYCETCGTRMDGGIGDE